MAKRKRSESPLDTATAPDRLLKQQKKQAVTRLSTAHTALVAALRLGAGFERQKHSRRKKTASQKRDTKALSRLDDEYRVLKALDLEKVAEQHVRRTIAKVKSLKDHAALPENVKEIEKGDNNAARLNVLARLYKVAAVKKEVDALIDDLKDVVGEEKKAEVKPVDMDELDISDEDGVAAKLFNARIAAPSSGEESDGDLSDDERPPSVGESETDAEDEGETDAEESDSSSASDAASDSKSKPIPKQTAKAKATASEFIPALSHAAYFSGDESASSLDEKPRKNRRGQRARQKIAEAKYGKAAKHVEKNERKQGWDAKRGAMGSEGRPSNRKDRRAAEKGLRANGRGPVISGENAAPLGTNRLEKRVEKPERKAQKDDLGTLHPSWAAAKAAKESKKLKIDMGASKKKITFD